MDVQILSDVDDAEISRMRWHSRRMRPYCGTGQTAMTEDASLRRLGSMLIDMIADARSLDILTWRCGPNAEGGWQLQALSPGLQEQWLVSSDRLYDGACELAQLVEFELEDG